jgi:hypothetical protein
MTVLMVLAAWCALSVPASLLVLLLLRRQAQPELIGMSGSDAVYIDRNGHCVRVPLGEPASH